MHSTKDSLPEHFANCGGMVVDRYCGHCGQARFVDADRRFSHLLKLGTL